MNIPHTVTVKIAAGDLTKLLIDKLELPADTKVTYDITAVSSDPFDRDIPTPILSSVSLTYQK